MTPFVAKRHLKFIVFILFSQFFGALNYAQNQTLTIPLGHVNWLFDAKFSANDKYLATTASMDNSIKIWDSNTGRLLRTYAGLPFTDGNNSWLADSETICFSNNKDSVEIWNFFQNKQIISFPGALRQLSESNSVPTSRNFLLTASGNKVFIWNLTDKSLYNTLICRRNVRNATYSNDGRMIITISDNGTIIWDAFTGKMMSELEGVSKPPNKLCFSPDEKKLLCQL